MKTDNHNIGAKLELRRYFLRRYHKKERINVLDCCQGDGCIWARLRKEFKLESYFGVDLKPKPGRLKIDSVRLLDQPGWEQNVIDVDTYGSPWRHWMALLRFLDHPATIFLTWAKILTGGSGNLSAIECDALGVKFEKLKLPGAFSVKLSRLAFGYCLFSTGTNRIIEIQEALSEGNARYIGVRLEPKK